MADNTQKEPPRRRGWEKAIVAIPKGLLWFFGVVFSLLLILFVASFFLDEPLRKSTEAKLNEHIKDYTIKVPSLHFQLIGLSVTLKNLTISQNAHPDPPIARIPLLKSSVDWRALLHAKAVGSFYFDRPQIHVNLPQLKTEAASKKTKVHEKRWQQALEDVYPLKINHLTINNGDIVYIDQDPDRPLHLAHINVRVGNIRNVSSPDQVYPSSFHVDTVVFGTGKAVLDGDANFLAEPFPGVKGDFRLKEVPLNYLKPILARYHVTLRSGKASASGSVEYAPKIAKAHVKEVRISGLDADYISTPGVKRVKPAKVAKKTKELSNKPELQLRLDDLKMTGATLGMINDAAGKHFRVFITDADIDLKNLSNQFVQGPADAKVSGKFMGSGATTASARFRPEKTGPDFDLALRIKDTQLKSMNDLLRAYGKFDVSAGLFSMYTELHVKNNRVTGYVKPLFSDLKVYDRRKDKEKSMFKKMYEKLVGGVAKLLENRPREEVATKAEISGSLAKPKTSTLQVIVELITNAFFKAILPGFESEVTRQKKQ